MPAHVDSQWIWCSASPTCGPKMRPARQGVSRSWTRAMHAIGCATAGLRGRTEARMPCADAPWPATHQDEPHTHLHPGTARGCQGHAQHALLHGARCEDGCSLGCRAHVMPYRRMLFVALLRASSLTMCVGGAGAGRGGSGGRTSMPASVPTAAAAAAALMPVQSCSCLHRELESSALVATLVCRSQPAWLTRLACTAAQPSTCLPTWVASAKYLPTHNSGICPLYRGPGKRGICLPVPPGLARPPWSIP